MAGWLVKASNVFRKTTPEVEHPFAVQCRCGLMHRGMRRNRSQKIVCRECGAARFVLPRDVYPPPKNRPLEAPAPPPELPVLNPVKPGAAPRPRGVSPKPKTLSPQAARDAAPEFFVVPARRRLVTPFRLVAIGIALVAFGTGYFTIQNVRRERAAAALREATDHAWEAVENADWPKAREQFDKAQAAASVLGRQDRAVRRNDAGLRESRVLESLSPKTLTEIAQEADEMSADLEKWKKHFLTHYHGRWIVLDAPLSLENDAWDVPFPVALGKRKRGVMVRLQSNRLADLKEGDAGKGVVIAAQLASCSLSDDKKTWEVRFEPDSGFLWSLPETFAALGIEAGEFRTSEQTQSLLARQAELNGLEAEEPK
jgi:hypothetical protein